MQRYTWRAAKHVLNRSCQSLQRLHVERSAASHSLVMLGWVTQQCGKLKYISKTCMMSNAATMASDCSCSIGLVIYMMWIPQKPYCQTILNVVWTSAYVMDGTSNQCMIGLTNLTLLANKGSATPPLMSAVDLVSCELRTPARSVE